ncbi:MAG: PHP domain-containing protein, partial [Actinobacteria bacterium]|nr:PHP domain-containing protein [Actinomycetota bacterium]
MTVPAAVRTDWHSHSSRTDGADDAERMADAAQRAGLGVWGLSDHVRADSTWLDDYVTVTRALRRDGLTIHCGVEAKLLDTSGRLDLPPGLPALDYVLVADHQFPSAT